MKKLLIADDNQQIVAILKEYARHDGYDVDVAFDGKQALDLIQQQKYAIILLDVMMPKIDGFEVCRKTREFSMVPVIMITARGEDFEKIMGLDVGADDYIVKPFSPKEVMARIRAILRRVDQSEKKDQVLVIDNLKIDMDRYITWIDQKPLKLTKKEQELLWLFATYQNQVFSRDQLLDQIWGYDYFGDSRTVDSHIKRLRHKIDCYPHEKWQIATVWGLGYKLETQR